MTGSLLDRYTTVISECHPCGTATKLRHQSKQQQIGALCSAQSCLAKATQTGSGGARNLPGCAHSLPVAPEAPSVSPHELGTDSQSAVFRKQGAETFILEGSL